MHNAFSGKSAKGKQPCLLREGCCQKNEEVQRQNRVKIQSKDTFYPEEGSPNLGVEDLSCNSKCGVLQWYVWTCRFNFLEHIGRLQYFVLVFMFKLVAILTICMVA